MEDTTDPGSDGGTNWAPAAWASWLNFLLGVWTAAAPWTWGHVRVSAIATDNDVLFGILIALCALWAATTWYALPCWLNFAFGIWLIVSPFLLGYSTTVPRAMQNDAAVGVLVSAFALVAGLSKPGVYAGPTAGTGAGPAAE